jgi:hypothetical protein
MRNPNKIYLSAIRDGDVFKLVDQDGREVWGLKAITVSAAFDDMTEFNAQIVDASQTGEQPAYINKNAG